MIPVMCATNDDCVRACLASLLEMESRDVPNFFDNDDNGMAQLAMQEWLAARGMVCAVTGLPGDMSFEEFGAFMKRVYPDKHYMLWCNSNGDHAVIGLNGEIVWNPAWYKSPIDGPHSIGLWLAWMIAKL